MRMSAKAEYAVRAMTQLASVPAGDLLTTDEIAKSQGIPPQFLVDILSELRADRLVRSQRGRDGGYQLARPADQITLGEIEAAVAGEPESAAPVATALAGSSRVAASLKAAWDAAAEARAATLHGVTLADLVARSRGAGEPMYYI